MRGVRHAVHGTAIVLALAAFAPLAQADAPAAQQLFTDGKALMAQGKIPEACAKLEESQRLDPGLGTQFHLADCNARLGKTASAWAMFLEVAAGARAQGQDSRARLARTKAAALEPKLVRVEVSVVDRAPADLEVKRDDVVVGRAQWGSAVPVDPGTHVVAATAPGKKRWETTVSVPPDAKVVHVVVPALVDADPPPAAVAASPAPTAPAQAPAATDASSVGQASSAPAATVSAPTTDGGEPRRGTAQRVLGAVSAGIGVAGVATGAYFGLHSKSLRDQSGPYCAGNVCNATGVSLRDDARSSGNVSTVAIGAGAALLVAGAVLWFTSPSSDASAARVHVAPRVGAAMTGVDFGGEF